MSSFLIILIVAVLILAASSFKIVNQSSVYMIEKLGKFNRKIDAGFHFVLPFIEKVSYKIDMRTQVLDSAPQAVITKDNVGMEIDTVSYYKITDPFKSVYEIDNVKIAILNIINTTLRDVIGGLELDETYTSRDLINARLRKELDLATDAWGVKVTRVEVKNIDPPTDIKVAMEKQMKAEREKRASILEAEGLKESTVLNAKAAKESAVLSAEAAKESQILAAEAEKTSSILEAEGKEISVKILAQAEADRIKTVYGALKDADIDDKILALESINALGKVVESDNKMLVPYESSALLGATETIKNLTLSKKD